MNLNKPSSTPTSRGPGRPSGDPQQQRARLLDAAAQAFAQTGIGAASLRNIAQEAGVTPAMISYYFGGKQQLVTALIEERLLPLFSAAGQQLQEVDGTAHELASRFVRIMSATVAQNSWLPGLWVREILCEGGLLREVLTQRLAPLVPMLLAQRFSAAKARGELNPQLNPLLLVVSLISLTLLPYAAAPIWQRIFPSPELGEETLIQHTLALLKNGLENGYALPTP
jgi:TetR/AcrR family transcriptional regulator